MNNAEKISVITLCRDNPDQLDRTLASLVTAIESDVNSLQCLVVDGSESDYCESVAWKWRKEFYTNGTGVLTHRKLMPQGIYHAANSALGMCEGSLISYMNAGDWYLPCGLQMLLEHWKKTSSVLCSRAACVFGQARVIPQAVKPWQTPTKEVRNIERWMRIMNPCHQAFLFDRRFAVLNPYSERTLLADRGVMRRAFAHAGPWSYLREEVCAFALGGESSRIDDIDTLIRRLQEDERSPTQKMAEVAKFAISRASYRGLEESMRLKAILVGLCCIR